MSNICIVGLPPGHMQKLSIEKPLSGGKRVQVSPNLIDQAHLFVLHNTRKVEPFIK